MSFVCFSKHGGRKTICKRYCQSQLFSLKLRIRLQQSCCLTYCIEEGANFKELGRARGTRMSFREKQVQEGYQIIHMYVNSLEVATF